MSDTQQFTYRGKKTVGAIIGLLLEKSAWFGVTPLPYGFYEVTVKTDAAHLLPADEKREKANKVQTNIWQSLIAADRIWASDSKGTAILGARLDLLEALEKGEDASYLANVIQYALDKPIKTGQTLRNINISTLSKAEREDDNESTWRLPDGTLIKPIPRGWVVRSESEEGYWSNDFGWVFDVASATVFPSNDGNLAMVTPDAVWVKVIDATDFPA